MLTASTTLTVGALLRRTREVARLNVAPTLAAFVVLVAFNVAVDQAGTGSGFTVLANLAIFAGSYLVQRTALERLGLRPAGARGRFGAMFGVNLLSGFGILLGLVALVIPGLILTARWWAVDPIVLAGETGVDDAMRRSWEATRTGTWPILGMLAAITAPFAALAVLGGSLDGVAPLASDILINVAALGWLTSAWTSQVALYSLLKPPVDALRTVFA